jgi:hypothetical protein
MKRLRIVSAFTLSQVLLASLMLFPHSAWANDGTPEPSPSSSLEWDQTPVPGSQDWVQPERTLDSVFGIAGGSYNPPPEASNGVGGWAVVHPGTGIVHGVIVATIDTYHANNGRMQTEYMGCPAGCLLRFQTVSTSDGNVAGWHGPEVTFQASDQSFTIVGRSQNEIGTSVTTQKLVPSLTSSNGINIETGFVDIRTDFTSSKVNGLSVKLTKMQEAFDTQDLSIVEFEGWNTFLYLTSTEMLQNLNFDVERELIAQNYVISDSQEVSFVDTVKQLSAKVVRFFGGFFD